MFPGFQYSLSFIMNRSLFNSSCTFSVFSFAFAGKTMPFKENMYNPTMYLQTNTQRQSLKTYLHGIR